MMRTTEKVRPVLGAMMLANLVPGQALFWVACYLTTQSYGGPAEGGWWHDEGELVTDPDIYRTWAARCGPS